MAAGRRSEVSERRCESGWVKERKETTRSAVCLVVRVQFRCGGLCVCMSLRSGIWEADVDRVAG